VKQLPFCAPVDEAERRREQIIRPHFGCTTAGSAGVNRHTALTTTDPNLVMAAFPHGMSPSGALRDLEIQRVFHRTRAFRPSPSRTKIQPREIGSSSVTRRCNRRSARVRATRTVMAKTLTRNRIWAARAIALAADAVQVVLFPLFVGGAPEGADAVMDVGVAALLCWLCGFQAAFLPTFIGEAMPTLDLFPSWTLAVLFVTRKSAAKLEAGAAGPSFGEHGDAKKLN
jgi:hypothetical protein